MKDKQEVKLTQNLSNSERVFSLMGGSYLLYNAFSKKGSGFLKAATAGYLYFRGATGHCPISNAIGIGEVDNLGDINITTSLTVNKPREEVYKFWRNLENLPKFMKHLKDVSAIDETVSSWEANIPGNVGTISWKSEIVEDIENEHIGWQSLSESTIENTGNVRFRDAGKFGTEVNVVISYRAPLGSAGEGIAKMLNPVFESMVQEDVKNFRRYMEAGEVPTAKGQPSGS